MEANGRRSEVRRVQPPADCVWVWQPRPVGCFVRPKYQYNRGNWQRVSPTDLAERPVVPPSSLTAGLQQQQLPPMATPAAHGGQNINIVAATQQRFLPPQPPTVVAARPQLPNVTSTTPRQRYLSLAAFWEQDLSPAPPPPARPESLEDILSRMPRWLREFETEEAGEELDMAASQQPNNNLWCPPGYQPATSI
ncbi:hypothetical protein EJ07DRAFT_181833 [Lizonia empirigonia]|nr:hypothetical protein EJ07DRAFT_181833 [Lizonia empirigonia]